MGPMVKLTQGPTSIAETTTETFPATMVRKACNSATFLIHVTSIGVGDTWGFALNTYFNSSARIMAVANKTGITATGLYRAALASNFDTERFGIITPREAVVTNTTPGAAPEITYDIYAVYGD